MALRAQAQPETFQDAVASRLDSINKAARDALDDESTRTRLLTEADEVTRALATWASRRDSDLTIAAARTSRFLHLAASAPPGKRAETYTWLATNEDLATTIAFTLTEADDPALALKTLNTLRDKFSDQKLATYRTLTAALCVVHDRPTPFTRSINENRATSPGPAPLFDYFTRNERQMLFGLRALPPELLVFVVDAAASINELNWALNRFAGDRAIGKHFFDIRYDYNHYRNRTPKKVTLEGFTLQNIAQYGGVCADQAHYAVTAGKAIGVPTAYVVGKGGELSHAWVGYLEGRGTRADWNFDEGRYREYRGVRGTLLDPQSGVWIADDQLGLLSRLSSVSENNRLFSVAILDAAESLSDGIEPPEGYPLKGQSRQPRVGREGVLDLAELALRANPANRRGWELVRVAVADPAMSMRERIEWSGVIMRLCEEAGAEHFMVSLLEPMIESIDDPRERIRIWERVLSSVKTKKDLRARIRMIQAEDARDADDRHSAYLAYKDVLDRYLNDTRESQAALTEAIQMLAEADAHDESARLFADVLRRVDRPTSAAAFSGQSNYAVAMRLAEAYSSQYGIQINGVD